MNVGSCSCNRDTCKFQYQIPSFLWWFWAFGNAVANLLQHLGEKPGASLCRAQLNFGDLFPTVSWILCQLLLSKHDYFESPSPLKMFRRLCCQTRLLSDDLTFSLWWCLYNVHKIHILNKSLMLASFHRANSQQGFGIRPTLGLWSARAICSKCVLTAHIFNWQWRNLTLLCHASSKLSTAQESLRRQACPISGRFKISPHVATVVTSETSNVGHQRIRLCSAPCGCKAQLILRFLLRSAPNTTCQGGKREVLWAASRLQSKHQREILCEELNTTPFSFMQLYDYTIWYDMCMSRVIHSAWTAHD